MTHLAEVVGHDAAAEGAQFVRHRADVGDGAGIDQRAARAAGAGGQRLWRHTEVIVRKVRHLTEDSLIGGALNELTIIGAELPFAAAVMARRESRISDHTDNRVDRPITDRQTGVPTSAIAD